jgi:hypothetical protein
MSLISKIFLFCIILFGPTACTVYTEKQTEAVSQVVYATKDSIDRARFDLADSYSTEATRLIQPPKNRIHIQSVSEVPKATAKETKNLQTATSKVPVIIVPERLRGLKVIVVNSQEYNELMLNKEALDQLKVDHANLEQAKRVVDQELIAQAVYRDKMVKELNLLKQTISNKNLIIMKLSFGCVVLGTGLVAGIALRLKGIL